MKALRVPFLAVLLLGPALAQSNPGIDAVLSVQPVDVEPGQPITVSMAVHNEDSSQGVTGLSPLLLPLQEGFGAALLSGPLPASQDLPVLGNASFTWTFSGSECGSVYFSGSASGTDGAPVSCLASHSDIVSMICTPTVTPVVIYATATPLPPQGSAVILGNVYHPLQGQSLQMAYVVPFSGPIDVSIYNRNGKKLKEIQVDAQAGAGSLSWDGRAEDGSLVSSGIYAAFFRGKGLNKIVKLVVVK